MIREYITYLKEIKGYSENTLIAYEKDLRAFASYMRQRDAMARWSNITMSDIDDYIIAARRNGKKPTTTNRELAAISGIYNYFMRQGLMKENPCKYESRSKIKEALPNTIPSNELAMAFIHADGWAAIMIGILATTGIRIQELLDLRWQDIDWNEETLRINGKGNKQRIVYCRHDVLEMLKPYKGKRQWVGKIFGIDQREARAILYKALKPYCSVEHLSPHVIRHTLATEMAKNGANVTTIAKILGHRDIRTTQKYIDMTQMQVQRALANTNILN